MGADDKRDEPGKPERPLQETQPNRSYEFSIAGQQLMRCKSKRIAHRKLSISDVATVTVGAKYKEGSHEREVIIPKVPAFLYDCASVLYSNADNSSEIFRKSGSQKRMNDFLRKHADVHVHGCSFENSGLSELDVSGLFKLYLRQHLEPTLFAGDPILDEITRILEEHQCVNFDLDISPELGTLIFVIKFLHSLCLKHPQSQQLTAANLAIVFAPGIIQHQKPGMVIDPKQTKEHIQLVQKLIENSFKLGVHIADSNLHRVRSTSISTDRSKNYDCSRRSSSVIGRFMKYMAKDRPKRVYAAPYVRVKTSMECSPEARNSRPLARGSTRMRREDVLASFEKAGEINNRISLKDTVFSGTGSPTSPFTRCSMSSVPFDEEKRRQQIQNSSLTTLPPGESTFNCNNGATLRNTLPVQEDGQLDDNFLLSPELDVSLTNIMSPKRIPLDRIFIQPPKEPSTATIYAKTPANPKVEKLDRIEPPIQDDFPFKKPELSVSRPRTHKIEGARLAPTRQTYKSLLSLPPGPRQPTVRCATTQAAGGVQKPQPARRRRSSGLGFGSSDMVDLIRSSSDQETLTEAANVLSSNRPSIALLKQKQTVTQNVAKFERQASAEEMAIMRKKAGKLKERESAVGEEGMNGEEEPFEDEDIEEPEEWNEQEGATVEKEEDDYQKEFKVLGQQNFHTLSKINVTSSWVENAIEFPAELDENNLSDLSSMAGFPSELFKKVQNEIKQWFPVQKSVIPVLLADILKPPVLRPRDITISAPTGSGKTLCYVLPSLTMIGQKPIGRLTVLILVPVQTLVKQIEQEFDRFNVYGAQVTALSGADEYEKELKKLSLNGNRSSDVIIATPARFMEHLMARTSPIRLDFLRLLVVDEADRMGMKVRMEWLETVEKRSGGRVAVGSLREVLNTRRAPRKLLLSATLSKDIEELHMWNLHKPCLFRASVTSSEEVKMNGYDHVTGVLALPGSIEHEILEAEKSVHPLVIHRKIFGSDWTRVLIFVNEKSSAFRLGVLLSALSDDKYKVENLTADLFGRRREKVLRRFKVGTTRVLICSDVLARGVDVPDIDCVVNYDLPTIDRLFIHRAGRTGRAGKRGALLSIGDKESRRWFKSLLEKTGLWNNVAVTLVGSAELEAHMEAYQKALADLKERMAKEKENGSVKTKIVSGLEYKRKRKWIPGLKEKREAEKMAKRGIWKSKKNEKKDY